ncbi:hypothetical protein DPMN_097310 [Dreissena polymorpha]|uniref:Uncharacterized protein n=1 Tax=Dreissena polymorpha TaxID=45954 RepID=A0A9D4R4H0_DREPO|nr:hypothetical protein DPMN_097310 [Dreissena polymorpha]
MSKLNNDKGLYGVVDEVSAWRSGVRGFDSHSGSVLIISSIDTKYWFFQGNGLDSVNICQ